MRTHNRRNIVVTPATAKIRNRPATATYIIHTRTVHTFNSRLSYNYILTLVCVCVSNNENEWAELVLQQTNIKPSSASAKTATIESCYVLYALVK